MAATSSLRTFVDAPGAAAALSARAPYTLTTVETSQARVAVWQSRAHGLPLVFLHDTSMCKNAFAAQFHGLPRRQHRLMAIDLPGHGASSDAREPHVAYTLEGYGDTVVEVLEHFDLDQAVLVGWKLGGLVALNVLARYPGIVGVMLISTDLSADERLVARNTHTPIAIVRGIDDPLTGADVLDECALGNPWDGGRHVLPGGSAPFMDSPLVFDELLGRFAKDMTARAADLRARPTLMFGG